MKVKDLFMSDNLHKSNLLKQKGFSMTVDIQKVFDSVHHIFFFHVLEKYEFGKNPIRLIEFLVKNQE